MATTTMDAEVVDDVGEKTAEAKVAGGSTTQHEKCNDVQCCHAGAAPGYGGSPGGNV